MVLSAGHSSPTLSSQEPFSIFSEPQEVSTLTSRGIMKPVVQLRPSDGTSVSGLVNITVNVWNSAGKNQLTPIITIDGVRVASAFSFLWDTNEWSEGAHNIVARVNQTSMLRPTSWHYLGLLGFSYAPATNQSHLYKPLVVEASSTVVVDNLPGPTGYDIYQGTVNGSTPDLWFSFDAKEGGDVRAVLSYMNSRADLDLYLYSPSDYDNYVARAFTMQNPEVLTHSIDESGLWLLKVSLYSTSMPPSQFTLTVAYLPNDPDLTPPTAAIITPSNSSVVGGVTFVRVSASDDRGIHSVRLFVNNSLAATDLTAPYYFDWDTTLMTETNFTLHVRVTDLYGNSANSSLVQVSVNQTSGSTFEGQRYAIIVGVSDYKKINDLSYCDEDVTDWFNYLTTSLGYNPNNIWVLGDSHPANYPKYDDLATEANLKTFFSNLVDLVGPNDQVLFLSSGHGSGDFSGASLLNLWDSGAGEDGEDGDLWDFELAELLEPLLASNIFVFLDHCLSGGFGPDLMSLGNEDMVYLVTTCGEAGSGWDDSSSRNGLWTYWFLERTLIETFGSNPSTTMEEAFAWASAHYPYQPPSTDAPQEYDGDPTTDVTI